MAEVFVAVARGADGFEKPVVIKRLLPQLAQIPRFQTMFLDEARIMLNLQHGNIVQIQDMGRMEGLPYLALEYVDGKDLRTVLRRVQDSGLSMPHGLSAYVASEVCRALDYAHRKTDEFGRSLNIVHRDVNPANIFISHEGMVKVGDFGLAKARDNLDRSETGIIKGKFSYLSPEQAQGAPLDHRSDIFSLGTTLYEMTCLVRPFPGETDVEVLTRVREATFTPPTEVIPGFNNDLEDIILRAMQQDPDDRYPTANHMREDLIRFLQRLPTAPGDRQLTDFLDGLFSEERRSNSFLIRLAPIGALPPPMTSVSHAGGVSEFQRSASPPPTPTAPVRARVRPPTPPVLELDLEPDPDPARKRRVSTGTVVLIAAVLVAGIAVVAALVYRAMNPPTASLNVLSAPSNAQVLLDGQDTGRRTPALLTGLALGRDHVVTVRHPEAADAQRSFRFSQAGQHAYQFNLEQRKEVLVIQSEPPACDVLVDDELRGQTPIILHLERGKKYAIALQKKGHLPKTLQHHADRDKNTLRIQLEPEESKRPARRRSTAAKKPARAPRGAAGVAASGVLEVATTVKANVYIDNRFVGRTPNFRMMLPAGDYTVTVMPDGAKIRHEGKIIIEPQGTHRFTLTPPK
jgi:serine/threonine protein kinase